MTPSRVRNAFTMTLGITFVLHQDDEPHRAESTVPNYFPAQNEALFRGGPTTTYRGFLLGRT
jgi:hypothetical protein